jgi:hypothetical protein
VARRRGCGLQPVPGHVARQPGQIDLDGADVHPGDPPDLLGAAGVRDGKLDEEVSSAPAHDHVGNDIAEPVLQDSGVEAVASAAETGPSLLAVRDLERRQVKAEPLPEHLLRELVQGGLRPVLQGWPSAPPSCPKW